MHAVGFFFIVLLVGAVAGIQKVLYYAKDPQGPKECPPLNPVTGEDSTKNVLSISKEDRIPNWKQRGGYINDASCLNKTAVHGVIEVRRLEDIQEALTYARKNHLHVSVAGVRHSMGGHAFSQNGIVLDMRPFNEIQIHEAEKTITVQSGATWHDIQTKLHPKFAIKSMQSTDIFTVGGSISVNAHGMDHTSGSVAKTLRSFRIITPDGTLKHVTKENDPELFRLVVGGYGLFGVITDAEIDITDNVMYEYKERLLPYKQFPEFFKTQIEHTDDVGLMYAHLSTAPQSLLQEMIVYTYSKTNSYEGAIPPLAEVSSVEFRRFVLNMSKWGPLPMAAKWWAEKNIEPKLTLCHTSRNQAMKDGEACFVSRNEPMHDSVKYLQNDFVEETDILQEYYIPRDMFVPYIDHMREIFREHKANVLNASVRVIHKEDTYLNYAPQDMFAIVLYINQKTDKEGNEKMRVLTRALVDATLKVNGTFFLPYQLHYTKEELVASYPQISSFFNEKKLRDPEAIFSNMFYEKYASVVD